MKKFIASIFFFEYDILSIIYHFFEFFGQYYPKKKKKIERKTYIFLQSFKIYNLRKFTWSSGFRTKNFEPKCDKKQ